MTKTKAKAKTRSEPANVAITHIVRRPLKEAFLASKIVILD